MLPKCIHCLLRLRLLIWSAQDHHEDKDKNEDKDGAEDEDEDECSSQTSDELSQAEPVSLTKRAKKRKGVLTVLVASNSIGVHRRGTPTLALRYLVQVLVPVLLIVSSAYLPSTADHTEGACRGRVARGNSLLPPGCFITSPGSAFFFFPTGPNSTAALSSCMSIALVSMGRVQASY